MQNADRNRTGDQTRVELERGFLRIACDGCRVERLVAFSCKRRGFCPSCGARRMAESAALLVDEVFPARPVRRAA